MDEIKRVKADTERDQEKLNQLLEVEEQTLDIVSAKECLTEFCETVHQLLNDYSLEEKRLALDELHV